MQKFIGLFIALLSLVCHYAFAANKQDILLIDDSVQFNPAISLRSLETGVPLSNQQYQDNRQFVWHIEEIDAKKTPFKLSHGLSQFKALGFDRCLYTFKTRLIVSHCDPLDSNTLWALLPTDTGALQIESIGSGKCLTAGNSYSDFRLGDCVKNQNTSISVKNLWFLAPPFTPAKISPAFAPNSPEN